jgi:hypothetical protein
MDWTFTYGWFDDLEVLSIGGWDLRPPFLWHYNGSYGSAAMYGDMDVSLWALG